MAFRHILVPIFGYDGDRAALDAALTLANRGGAHIGVLHVKIDPLESTPLMVDVGVAIAELVEAAERHVEARAKRATETFETWRRERDLKIDDQPNLRTGVTTAYTVEKGAEDELIIRFGRLTDLVVIGRPTGADAADQAAVRVEDALFGAGRPVLLVPGNLSADGLNRIVSGPAVISWNGSIEATRAVTVALDLMKGMDKVRVISVKEGRKDRHPSLDLVRYLAWQGVAASVADVPATGHSTADKLVAAAHELKAGLIVMGGYSHGRLRQLVLGGVTSHMIDHADLPVLMAH